MKRVVLLVSLLLSMLIILSGCNTLFGTEEIQQLKADIEAQNVASEELLQQIETQNLTSQDLLQEIEAKKAELSEKVVELESTKKTVSDLLQDIIDAQGAAEKEMADTTSLFTSKVMERIAALKGEYDVFITSADAKLMAMEGIQDEVQQQEALAISTIVATAEESENRVIDQTEIAVSTIYALNEEVEQRISDQASLSATAMRGIENECVTEVTNTSDIATQTLLAVAKSYNEDATKMYDELTADANEMYKDFVDRKELALIAMNNEYETLLEELDTVKDELMSFVANRKDIVDTTILGATESLEDQLLSATRSLEQQMSMLNSRVESVNEEYQQLKSAMHVFVANDSSF